MDSIFQIGDFTFRLCCPPEVTPPANFMKFESTMGTHLARAEEMPEYTYNITVSDDLPQAEGAIIAQRPDLTVFRRETEQGGSLESRLIGVKGNPEYYACYREVSGNRAEVTLVRDRIAELHIDPMFTSLLALEHDPPLRLCGISGRGHPFLRSVGDRQDNSGEPVGEVPGKPDGQRRPFPSGEDQRQVDGSGVAGVRHV